MEMILRSLFFWGHISVIDLHNIVSFVLDQVIYPGKVLDADCFRIGNIGHLFPDDMRHLLVCIKNVLKEMKMEVPLST